MVSDHAVRSAEPEMTRPARHPLQPGGGPLGRAAELDGLAGLHHGALERRARALALAVRHIPPRRAAGARAGPHRGAGWARRPPALLQAFCPRASAPRRRPQPRSRACGQGAPWQRPIVALCRSARGLTEGEHPRTGSRTQSGDRALRGIIDYSPLAPPLFPCFLRGRRAEWA
jgi:hypothetical protein